MSMERYICIHGHFYQPPRENPWLEAIELQDSAYPYHDWNERITAECYGPNGASRILDDQDRIVSIVNNYSNISFNVGPTLLSWMEEHAPESYAAVLDADALSRKRFSGHGSAMAQAYNHLIMPLASRRDKVTQVVWGIRDFEHRFQRRPEGLWLPETAVDIETLEVLAENGIAFTVLAPSQAKRVRELGAQDWTDVADGSIDPTRPYRIELPSGTSLALFFYDGPISRAVAFEKLLNRGEHLAGRLQGAFNEERDWPQLVHIATDGETYGHHHRNGDMALAYALHHIEKQGIARLTNYGEYLERHPPTHEVEILELTAWSCVHGLGRWRQDCGCNSGGQPGWNQAWREPLRNSLDWLRDRLAPLYESAAGELLRAPWAARDAYVDVILDRSPEGRERFLAAHATRELDGAERVRAWKLLELQRQMLLSYTSCGWFFDELSGIETVQVIRYAGAAIQHARELFADDVEPEFLSRLGEARSNLAEHGNGAAVYEKWVRPSVVDIEKVAAHYAISSLFEGREEHDRVYSYEAERLDERVSRAGRARLVLGQVRLTSRITGDSSPVSYGVLHFGGHNVNGGVRLFRGEEAFEQMALDAIATFERAELAETIRAMDRHFGESNYSLKNLFRDEQRRILGQILDSTLEEAAAVYSQIYENHAPLMRFLGELDVPLPHALEMTAEFVLNTRLRTAFEVDPPDLEAARTALDAALTEGAQLDRVSLGFTIRESLERLARSLAEEPEDLARLSILDEVVAFGATLPFEVDLDRVQTLYYRLHQERVAATPAREAEDAGAWLEQFRALGERLAMRVDG
jgi:alpha-amylase/alpha-mannosidase (GH57 family)